MTKKCMPGCKGQSYSVSSSESVYPGQTNFIWEKNFCFVVRKLKKTCASEKKAFLGKHENHQSNLLL